MTDEETWELEALYRANAACGSFPAVVCKVGNDSDHRDDPRLLKAFQNLESAVRLNIQVEMNPRGRSTVKLLAIYPAAAERLKELRAKLSPDTFSK